MTIKFDIWMRFDEFQKKLSLKIKNIFRIINLRVWVVPLRSRCEKKISREVVTSSKVRTIILNSGSIVLFKLRNFSKEIGQKFVIKNFSIKYKI